jgi:hypothetical protein
MKLRNFKIEGSKINYYENEEGTLKGTIESTQINSMSYDEKTLSIHINCFNRLYELEALEIDDFNMWIDSILDLMEEFKEIKF